MADSQRFLDPESLVKIHPLQLRAKRIVEGTVSGLHRSPFHGYSLEFSEHREYTPGDDLRHLDWKVFGRTDKFYLKRYEDETNLTGHLVVDRSESMWFRGPDSAMTKYEYASSLAASLGWLILEKQDSASLHFLDDNIEQAVEVGGGAPHLLQISKALEDVDPVTKTDLAIGLSRLSERISRRGVVILFSDFFDDVGKIVAGLKRLVQRKHDVICFHVMDPCEIDLPFKGPTRFRGMEQFDSAVADPASLRKVYRQTVQTYLEQLRKNCLDNRIDYCFLKTDENFGVALAKFLHERSRRIN